MNKHLYHYTSKKNQKSILKNKTIYFREINDFNKNNNQIELIIDPYYKYVISVLKDKNPDDNYIQNLPNQFDYNLITKSHQVRYSFYDTYHEDNLVPIYVDLESKVYIACFSENPNSIEMYKDYNQNNGKILKIDKNNFKSIIQTIIFNEFKKFLDVKFNSVKGNYTKLGKNISCYFEKVLGFDYIYFNKVNYLSIEKHNSINFEIFNKSRINNQLHNFQRNKSTELLMNMIYVHALAFKEYKYAFEDETRLIIMLPKFIADKYSVQCHPNDLVAFPIKNELNLFQKRIIKPIKFKQE
jgi:hypothetical protein